MTTIGFIGAGNIGANVARAASNAGYDVILSNNHGPDSLAELAADIGSRASTATTDDAVHHADVVVIAVPYTAFDALPAAALAGKVVLATTNYIPEYTGHIAELDDTTVTEVGMLQRRLLESKVVKAFSHLNAAEVPTTGTPRGTPNRRALAIAGNDPNAKLVATEIYDTIGYDTLDVGDIDESWTFGFGQPAFITHQNLEELAANVAKATRKTP
jgi:8-hydroxy-5-deazaflavin:NADPH oxidoreductase